MFRDIDVVGPFRSFLLFAAKLLWMLALRALLILFKGSLSVNYKSYL
jgi:hypothetical protein